MRPMLDCLSYVQPMIYMVTSPSTKVGSEHTNKN